MFRMNYGILLIAMAAIHQSMCFVPNSRVVVTPGIQQKMQVKSRDVFQPLRKVDMARYASDVGTSEIPESEKKNLLQKVRN